MSSASVVAFDILARDRASGVIAKAGGNVERTTNRMSSRAKRAALGFATLAGVTGIGSVVTSSVQLEAAFSKTMNVIQATSGASGRQMKALSSLAVKMGADTVFSAGDAAQAMLELSRGGIKPAQIAAGALKGTLTLAAAGELQMGEAANIAVKPMGQFGLKGKDMGKIAAALAGGANASSASVRDMSQALAQGGLAANSVGFSIQETTAILAAFSNKGLEGSDAGTALKTMLDRLVPSTLTAEKALQRLNIVNEDGRNKFLKANGEYKSAAKIAEVLRKSTEKLSSSERKRLITQAFGSDAQRAATVLARVGAKGIRDLTKATSDQGAAEKTAAANMKGTAGALEQFQGSLETAKLRLGQFLAPAVIRGLGLLTDGLNGLPDAAKKVADVFEAIPGPVKLLVGATAAYVVVAPRMASALVSIQGGLTKATASTVTFTQRLAQNRAAMSYQSGVVGKAREAFVGFGGAAKAAAGIGGLAAVTAGAQTSNRELKTLANVGGGAMMGFAAAGPIGAAVGGFAGLVTSMGTATSNTVDDFDKAKNAARRYKDMLNQATGAVTGLARAEIEKDLRATTNSIQMGAKLGLSVKDLTGAIIGQKKSVELVNFAMKRGAKGTMEQQNASQALAQALNGTDKAAFGAEKGMEGLVQKYRGMRGDLQDQIRRQKALRRAFEEIKNVKGDPKRWKADLKKGAAAGVASGARGGKDAATALKRGTSGARADLVPFNNSLRRGVKTGHGIAATGGAGIGSALGSGVYNGMGQWLGSIVSRAGAMVAAAVSAARKEADAHSPSRKMIKLGREMGQGLTIGMRRSGRSVGSAGAALLGKLVDGIRSKRVPVKKALAEVNGYMRQMAGQVRDLRTQRNDFGASFGASFGSSVFGNEGLTNVGSIIGAQTTAAAQAAALRSQVQGLVKAGLSKSLIQQMVQGGSAGAAQIAALSMANPQQIRQLNALDRATNRDLGAAGASAAGAVYNDRIAAARHEQSLAKALARELAKHEGGKKIEVHVHLEGKDIIYSIDKHNRQRGKKK